MMEHERFSGTKFEKWCGCSCDHRTGRVNHSGCGDRGRRSLPMIHDTYDDYDDDARSVSSGTSYMDALIPPLTARLPPAVRASHKFGGYHGQPKGSDRRLSQLEEKLRELEMEDWRMDRLILSANHGWKPDLPPRKSLPDISAGNEQAVSTHYHDHHDRVNANQQARACIRPQAPIEWPDYSRPQRQEQPENKSMQGAGQPAIRTPVQIQRMSRPNADLRHSLESPIASDSMLQTPVSAALLNGTLGGHTKFDELSAIRRNSHERSSIALRSSSSFIREADSVNDQSQRRDPDFKYSYSPVQTPVDRKVSPLNTKSSREAINFNNFKITSSPSSSKLSSASVQTKLFPAATIPARRHDGTDGKSFAALPPAEASPWQRKGVNGGIAEEDAWHFKSTESTKNAGQNAITTDALQDFGHQNIRSNTSGQLSQHSNRKDMKVGMNTSEENAESKMELAQQLLDHLLGQYFKKSDTFASLLAAASNVQATANITWVQWWPELEREVRSSIKPEMKAVYDSRCSELFSHTKQGMLNLFVQAPRRPSGQSERKLTIASIAKCTDPGTWALVTSQRSTDALIAVSSSMPLSWEEFWPQVDVDVKAGVKDYMRKVVKDEILAKFTDWRRRFHLVFTSVDKYASGIVPAVAFVRGLEESNLGMILGMYSSPSAKQLLNRSQHSNEAGAPVALAATDDGTDQPS